MIAHRLSTLESCDMLLRMKSGRMEAMHSDVAEGLREVKRESSVIRAAAEV
jgi:ABC-type bacteriocin/lantibiotic exporter with double-glycine peptidase domain